MKYFATIMLLFATIALAGPYQSGTPAGTDKVRYTSGGVEKEATVDDTVAPALVGYTSAKTKALSALQPTGSGAGLSGVVLTDNTRHLAAQRPYTKTICASNAANTAACDYVCTGTNDEVTIQTASTATGAGSIKFSSGSFNIYSSISVSSNNQKWIGDGESTVFIPRHGNNLPMVRVAAGGTTRHYGFRMKDIRFEPVRIAVTTMTGNGATVTVDTTAAHGLTTGEQVFIGGWVGGTGVWNGVYTITATDTDTFTYSATGNGTATSLTGSAGFVVRAVKGIDAVYASQIYLVNLKFTSFAQALKGTGVWDGWLINSQFFASGTGDTPDTAAVVLHNGPVDKIAGFKAIGSRFENWHAGHGNALLIDSSDVSGDQNGDVSITDCKFENYGSTSAALNIVNSEQVRIGGNTNFNGGNAPAIDINGDSDEITISSGVQFGRWDYPSNPGVYAKSHAIKSAGARVLIDGNYFRSYASDPEPVWFTSAATESRVANNLTNTSAGVAWVQNDSADAGIIIKNNQGDEKSHIGTLTNTKWCTSDGTDINCTEDEPAPVGGGVSSVGLALPAELTVTNSPVTTTGTLTGSWADQTTGKVFASPNGSTGTPAFRALAAADLGTTLAAQFGTIGVNAANTGAKVYVWGSTSNAIATNGTSGGTIQARSDSGLAIDAASKYNYGILATQYVATMGANATTPVAEVIRSLTLTGGYTALQPVLRVKNSVATTDANYGPLIQAQKGSTTVFQVNEDGTASLSGALTATGGIEVGHATDTTITRVSAGVIAVEGVTLTAFNPASPGAIGGTTPAAGTFTTIKGAVNEEAYVDSQTLVAQGSVVSFNSTTAATSYVLTLPAAAAGLNFILTNGITKTSSSTLSVAAASGDKIYLDGVAGTDGPSHGIRITDAAVGATTACWTSKISSTYDWHCKAGVGTWVAY